VSKLAKITYPIDFVRCDLCKAFLVLASDDVRDGRLEFESRDDELE
jgi:hypothetical protein